MSIQLAQSVVDLGPILAMPLNDATLSTTPAFPLVWIARKDDSEFRLQQGWPPKRLLASVLVAT
jgi:hypothetical protein